MDFSVPSTAALLDALSGRLACCLYSLLEVGLRVTPPAPDDGGADEDNGEGCCCWLWLKRLLNGFDGINIILEPLLLVPGVIGRLLQKDPILSIPKGFFPRKQKNSNDLGGCGNVLLPPFDPDPCKA